MAVNKIQKLSRVVKPKDQKSSGSSTSTQPGPISGDAKPGGSGGEGGMPTSGSVPKTVALSPDVVLSGDIVDRIDKMLQEEDEGWNIGKVNPGGQEAPQPTSQPSSTEPDGSDTRTWDKTPGQLEQEIDRAVKRGIEEARKAEREGKTDSEKTMGGSGGSSVRDRLEISVSSQIDWGKIFSTRLTEYSKEASKYLPYHRRFVSNPRMKTRIPSRTQAKDTLPELNLIVDTSSSLSYKELELILSEIKKAIQSAKIKLVNLILWTSTPYYYKTYKDLSGNKFNQLIDDVQENWQGGGNDVDTVYELMKSKGWSKKFTISLTDGYIRNHFTGSTKKLSEEVLDPNNTVFGIIYPNQAITYSQFKEISDRFPGEKLPIFLDSKKFY